jgi:cold shock CspA family protein
MSEILRGRIVRRVASRGFGFIRLNKSKKEYFYHMSGCFDGSDGFQSMLEGMPVTFEEDEGDKGPRAKNVALDLPEEATS